MSLSFLVILAARQVPTNDTWQGALQEHHVPLQFPYALDFAKNSGFVPVKVDGHESGFYIGKEDYSDLVRLYPALSKINQQGSVAFSLAFGGHVWNARRLLIRQPCWSPVQCRRLRSAGRIVHVGAAIS